MQLTQRRHAAPEAQSPQCAHQHRMIRLQQLVLTRRPQVLAQRRIEEIVQIDGGRRPAAELKIDEHRALWNGRTRRRASSSSSTALAVREHGVVHPNVTVDERMKVARLGVERPAATLKQMRPQGGQLTGVDRVLGPSGDQGGERIQQRQVERVEGRIVAVEHACREDVEATEREQREVVWYTSVDYVCICCVGGGGLLFAQRGVWQPEAQNLRACVSIRKTCVRLDEATQWQHTL